MTRPHTACIGLLALAGPALAADLLVAGGATWRYLDDGSDQGTAWSAIGFDDSVWAQGPAQLGYGDGDEATVVSYGPDSDNKYTTTYYRHEFQVPNPGAYTEALLRLVHDDGAVVYLNGVELLRSNMLGGAVTFSTFASSTISGASESVFRPFDLDPGLLLTGTNTLAVELHQRTLTSSDTSFDLDLAADTLPFVTRGPYLQMSLTDEIQIRWRTKKATHSVVRWGDAPGNLTESFTLPFNVFDHLGFVTGLSPQTRYYYSIGTSTDTLAGGDTEHYFDTPPLAGTKTPVRIWALGDSGTASPLAALVRDAYYGLSESQDTDLVLLLGDNAYDEGLDIEYQGGLFDMYADILRRTPVYPTRGNHDDYLTVYYSVFSLPALGQAGGVPSGTELYYSFDHANVHFICLDSDSSSTLVGGPMYTWLESDLLATDQDWIVAFWHHSPYTHGSHDSDTETKLVDMRTNIVPLLESHGVDLVLSGHSHSYERSYLIDGHYDTSATFLDSMKKDGGDGRPDGDGSYVKVMAPNQGAVYCVAGSAGKLTSPLGAFDHPAMYFKQVTLGSVILEVDDAQMDVRFLDYQGVELDWFTLLSFPDEGLSADSLTLSASSGGSQSFALDAGPSEAGKTYWVHGSLSGTSPGIPVGAVVLPLNYDVYLSLTLTHPGLGAFSGFLGALAGDGTAAAALTLPPGLGTSLVGLSAHHAYLVYDSLSAGGAAFASNAVELNFLP